MLLPHDIEKLMPAEHLRFRSPIPTQSVSSDEFLPATQSARQREFEARLKQLGSDLARKQGVSRRHFFQGAAGMAAAFVAMNDTYGPFYLVSRAEAQTPELANARAAALKGQFIMDMHTHFLRDDTRLESTWQNTPGIWTTKSCSTRSMRSWCAPARANLVWPTCVCTRACFRRR